MTSYRVEQDHMRGGWQVLASLTSNSSWHIATYRHKVIADEVADFLTDNADCECRG